MTFALGGCSHINAADCVAPLPRTTFLQLLNVDLARPASYWGGLFDNLGRLGFDRLILQWTQYDQYSYLHSRNGHEPALVTRVLDAAAARDMQVWLGLKHDSEWWKVPQLNDAELEHYLERRLADTHAQIEAARSLLASNPGLRHSIAGWYITDELDDVTWAPAARRSLLRRYLKGVSAAIRSGAGDLPILISGFSNGASTPEGLAADWFGLLAGADLNGLLFQDGIGAGKLGLEKFASYVTSLRHVFDSTNRTLMIVTELFQSDTNSDVFHAVSAPPARVARQLEVANAANVATVAFSAPDYLLNRHAKSALAQWWSARGGCE